MNHPLEWVPPRGPRWVLLAAAMAASFGLMGKAGPKELKAGGAVPCGIGSFELAGTEEEARGILGVWQCHEVVGLAREAVWWDYLFILAYGVATAQACLLGAQSSAAAGPLQRRLGVALAWGALAAMLLDAVENVGLLRMLADPAPASLGPWPRLAQVCAIPKFLLVLAAWLYVLGVLLWSLVVRWRGTRRPSAVPPEGHPD
jgi:hypothetical protein